MQIRAVIFDMDGILIDSEPFWRQAEMEIFGTVGLHLTEQQCMETTGLRIDEVVALRHAQHPWSAPSQADISESIVARVAALVTEHGISLPGVESAIEAVRRFGLRLALASSSSTFLIETTLRALNLGERFEVIQSAELEPLGKPHPRVYLKTAGLLQVDPVACLAIEDSLNGVISAKAARMRTVAIPEAHATDDPRFGVSDFQLPSLVEFPALLERLLEG